LAKNYGDQLAGTAYSCTDPGDGTLAVTCPWGNRLRLHQGGDRFGGMRLGLAYVELDVAVGTASGIARFYRDLFGAPAAVTTDNRGMERAEVRVGCAQALWFTETEAEIAPYDGHHIAVYLANFSRPYSQLLERGLITVETNDHEYRFQDIVDLDSGAVLTSLEHEVRSMFHPLFGRELVNRNPVQRITAYQPGEDSYVGLTHAGLG
jgi:hypothetical protein